MRLVSCLLQLLFVVPFIVSEFQQTSSSGSGCSGRIGSWCLSRAPLQVFLGLACRDWLTVLAGPSLTCDGRELGVLGVTGSTHCGNGDFPVSGGVTLSSTGWHGFQNVVSSGVGRSYTAEGL